MDGGREMYTNITILQMFYCKGLLSFLLCSTNCCWIFQPRKMTKFGCSLGISFISSVVYKIKRFTLCKGILCLFFHFSLQALLAARQEREIQLKMLLTRGEAVQRNTSAEGVPVIRKQIQDLKDSWDSLLSASIQCKR